jgi:predicted ATPase
MTSLPVALTTFIGRRAELSRLSELFGAGARLVTVAGPGGMGKTRLAQHFAATWGGDAIFLDLTQASTVKDVVNIAARTLDIEIGVDAEIGERLSHLGAALASRDQPLVVLDNCEQIVTEAATVLEVWMAGAERARFMVTTRELFGTEGEHVLELGPLGLPAGPGDTQADAFRLFVDRARLVRAGYDVGPDDSKHVITLLRQLDGLPLAVELAAGAMDVFDPQTLAARLQVRLDDLATRSRSVPERQRTLEAAIDGSWHSLSERERSALCQSSIFRGTFSVEAAEAIFELPEGERAAPTSQVIAMLYRKSLVRAFQPSRSGTGRRFGLYESIRMYAETRLRQSAGWEAAATRHGAYFERLASDALRTPEQRASDQDEALGADLDNFVAAHGRALAASPARGAAALRIALALSPYLIRCGSLDALSVLLDEAIARGAEGEHASLLARAHVARAQLMRQGAPAATMRSRLDEAIRLARAAGDVGAEGRALAVEVIQIGNDAEVDATIAQRLRALELLREANDDRWAANTLVGLAFAERVKGALTDARAHLAEAAERARRVGCNVEEAKALFALGNLLWALGDLDGAAREYEHAAELSARTGDEVHHGLAEVGLAQVLQEQGRFDDAARSYELGIELISSRRRTLQGWAIGYSATLLHERGDLEGARARYAVGSQVCHETSSWSAGILFDAAGRGAAGAALGHLDEARAVLDKAEKELTELKNGFVLEAVRLFRGHLELARARDAEAKGVRSEADDFRRRARTRLATVDPQSPNEDVRFARRLLARALDAAVAPTPTLKIAADGTWFLLPDGTRVELLRQKRLRTVLLALARSHVTTAQRAMSAQEIFAASWPGERAGAAAAANRVHVAMSTLRSLGLRSLIVRNGEGGYSFDPSVWVEMAPEDA